MHLPLSVRYHTKFPPLLPGGERSEGIVCQNPCSAHSWRHSQKAGSDDFVIQESSSYG